MSKPSIFRFSYEKLEQLEHLGKFDFFYKNKNYNKLSYSEFSKNYFFFGFSERLFTYILLTSKFLLQLKTSQDFHSLKDLKCQN